MTGTLAWHAKDGVCAIRVDALPSLELGCWFSTLEACEVGKDASDLEDASADLDAFVFEPKPFRLLKNEVLRAIPDAVGKRERDTAGLLVGTFATVRRRLKVLVANLFSVSENEDFLWTTDTWRGGSIAAPISATLSASSFGAISLARQVGFNEVERSVGAVDGQLR